MSCWGCSLEEKIFNFQDLSLSKYLVKLSCCVSLPLVQVAHTFCSVCVCVCVPLQPTTVCPSSSLSVHLMEVGNPVRCLQRVLPNLLANACARSSVIASSTLGGMKVALANSN